MIQGVLTVEPLPKSWKKLLDKVSKTVEDGDLYAALHRVGDDDTKSEIEDVLRRSLDTNTFNLVVAVFKVAVSDDLVP